MAFYRSIKDTTVQVEAVKFNGSRQSLIDIRDLISVEGENNLANVRSGKIFIKTRTGTFFVPRGYYVVKDSTEDIFISRATDFEDIYESGASTATSATVGSVSSDVDAVAADLSTLESEVDAHIADTNNPHDGVTDHGGLTGLTDDDHSQYHNNTRGDARYFTKDTFSGGGITWGTETDDTPTWNFSSTHRLKWNPDSIAAATLTISNMDDGDTGIMVIEATSSNGTLTLPATSYPSSISYTTSAAVLCTVVKYGSVYIWGTQTTGLTPS